MRVWQGICLSTVLLFSFGALCHAQSVAPEDEYKKLVKIDQDIQPLGAHPFGKNIGLSYGKSLPRAMFDCNSMATSGRRNVAISDYSQIANKGVFDHE
jgi:hypothetical protein